MTILPQPWLLLTPSSASNLAALQPNSRLLSEPNSISIVYYEELLLEGQVKEFHPDARRDQQNSDLMIRRVLQAYEILSNISRSEIIESECSDPFDNPEGEAFDIFVNEVVCVGKGCPYSCVKQAPQAFTFSTLGTARAASQGHAEDYQVQLAVGQCPRSCIHYVTPSQRVILEEVLDSILDTPYDTSAEADLLYSLIVKAKYENNRYQKPKKQPKASTEHVDWF